MLSKMYPLWSFILATLLAQGIKPFLSIKDGHIDFRLIFASGGYPSSHTAGVAALCMAVGLVEKFSSTLFAITVAFGIIVAYDAANVRYYAGKNITLTKKITQELKEKQIIDVDNHIYDEPLKEVLGHRWREVLAGALLGIAVALFLFWIIRR